MFTLTCRDTGLDFVIKGETMEEFLKSGANHAVEKHGMREEDFYLDGIPANLLCHSFIEETND
jgi:predicted small metal-binding protein